MLLSPQEERIVQSIIVGSENDPHKPEFPPNNPKFPATPTYQIVVPGFSHVGLKDESQNITGTHKDRMAWEIVVTYKEFLVAKKAGRIQQLPTLSILSSGSAALAVQTQLNKYGLPNLHVLMDVHTAPNIIKNLKDIGCSLFLADLSSAPFDVKDILRLTNNIHGFDITSNEAYDPTVRFYDWLSYEIINNDADYIFVPFGTGQLYENIMNVIKKELRYKINDPRFQGNKEKLHTTSVLGATTTNPHSKADKLYAPFLPFAHYSQQWIELYKSTGLTGVLSQVYDVQELYIDNAIKLAETQHIPCEPSGIAGLGLLLQLQNSIPYDAKILIVNTGKTKW